MLRRKNEELGWFCHVWIFVLGRGCRGMGGWGGSGELGSGVLDGNVVENRRSKVGEGESDCSWEVNECLRWLKDRTFRRVVVQSKGVDPREDFWMISPRGNRVHKCKVRRKYFDGLFKCTWN